MPINENYFIKIPEDSDNAYLKPGMDKCIHLKAEWKIVQKSSPVIEQTIIPKNENLFIDFAPQSAFKIYYL